MQIQSSHEHELSDPLCDSVNRGLTLVRLVFIPFSKFAECAGHIGNRQNGIRQTDTKSVGCIPDKLQTKAFDWDVLSFGG